MSTKETPKKETKSAPKKRVKPRGREAKADYLERVEAAPPVIGSPVIGESEIVGGFGVRGSHMGEITGQPGTGVRGNGPVGVSGFSGKGNGVIGEVREGELGLSQFPSAGVYGRHRGPDGAGQQDCPDWRALPREPPRVPARAGVPTVLRSALHRA
jgi:hypothetical protein